MHIIPAQAAYAAVLGVLLHLLALAGQSLWLPMIAHFLNNALSVMASCEDSPLRPWLAAAQQSIEAWPALFLPVGLGMCVAVTRHLMTENSVMIPPRSSG